MDARGWGEHGKRLGVRGPGSYRARPPKNINRLPMSELESHGAIRL